MTKDPDELILPFYNMFKTFKAKMGGFSKTTFNITEIGALHFINRHERVSMKELAEFLEITPPSTTALTDKMIKLNILKRSYDKKDRRTIILSLTKKGIDMFKKAREEKIRIFKEMLSRINEEEKSQLSSILNKMFKK